tara:strand:- start:260 stop:784 length:525 start_codon:yes stop_codon:yes gene_type:complete
MFRFSIFIIVSILILTSCNAFKPKKVDTREVPTNAQERARKNIEEGRGVSIDGLLGKVGGDTNFEFSTSNPMWRASLEILDFLPLTTVDYSGGMIITDWYSENSSNESIKITVRFLANEVRSDSIKIIVHKKTCSTSENCKVSLLDKSAIKDELLSSIVRKAAKLEADTKKKKR